MGTTIGIRDAWAILYKYIYSLYDTNNDLITPVQHIFPERLQVPTEKIQIKINRQTPIESPVLAEVHPPDSPQEPYTVILHLRPLQSTIFTENSHLVTNPKYILASTLPIIWLALAEEYVHILQYEHPDFLTHWQEATQKASSVRIFWALKQHNPFLNYRLSTPEELQAGLIILDLIDYIKISIETREYIHKYSTIPPIQLALRHITSTQRRLAAIRAFLLSLDKN